MIEEAFWRVIHQSRRDFDPALRDGNMDRQAHSLGEILSGLPADEVQAFRSVFSELHRRAYRWDLWGAAYIIGGGCSDDAFADFRDWLISMGRDVYESALSDPDSLAAVARAPGVECCFFEGFGYVARAQLERMGVDPESYPRRPHPKTPAGQRWAEEDLPRVFPRLWAAFGSHGDA